MVSCTGQYHFYSTTTLAFIGSCRAFNSIYPSYTNFQTHKASTITFINQNYFINTIYQTLFIFYVNASTNTVSLLGSYNNVNSVQYVGGFNLINKLDNSGVYGVQLTVYSFIAMEQIVIPFISITTCTFSTTAQLFSGSLTNLQSTYSQMKLFSSVATFRLVITLTDGINLPLFPSFTYSSQSQLVFTPLGVSSPPTTAADQSVRIQVYASTQFFQSASQYNQLIMNNLKLNFQYNPLQSSVSTFTSPLANVNLSYIDIVSNVPNQQINFNSVPTIAFSQMTVAYTPTTPTPAARLLAQHRELTAATTYVQSSYFSFVDIGTLNLSGITITGQTLTDLTLFSIQNSGDDIASQSSLSASTVVLDTITFSGNTLASTIPTSLQSSQINSIISISLIPTVTFSNIQILNNASTQDFMQGILNMQAVLSFTASNCVFSGNQNIFFLFSNTTYASASITGTNNFNTRKYYQLQGTSITFNSVTLTSNKYDWFIQSLIIVNAQTFTGTTLTATGNQLINSANQNALAASTSIINFINVITVTINTITFSSNTNYQQGLVKISKSASVTISTLTFTSNTLQQGALYVSGVTALTMVTSSFTGNKAALSGTAIYSDASTLTLTGVTFSTQTSSSKGGSIFIQDSSTLNLSGCTFDTNTSSGEGGAIYASSSIISASTTTFNKCTAGSSGGAIYATSTSLTLTTVTVTNSVSSLHGGAISAESGSTIIAATSTFTANTSLRGGAINIANAFSTTTNIQSSKFTSNVSFGSGGALMIDTSDISVSACYFISNVAGYGGAIRYIQMIPSFMKNLQPSNLRSSKDANGNWIIQGNYYSGNTGYVLGPDIGSQLTMISPYINTTDFTFETLILDNPNQRYQTALNIAYQYRLSQFRSGEANFDFQVTLMDTLQQQINANYSTVLPKGFTLSADLLSEITSIFVKVNESNTVTKIEDQSISVDGSTVQYYQQSKDTSFFGISLNSISITGIPGNTGGFCLQFTGLSRINSTNYFVNSECIYFLVEFRECIVGEIFLPRCTSCLMNQCEICSNGTYSLIEPLVNSGQSCKPCQSQYASSCYSDQITVKPGYWRSSLLTDEFFACDSSYNSCNGNQTSNYCETGYKGALCEACDQNGIVWGDRYGLSSMYSDVYCHKCSDMAGQMAYQIIFLVVTGFYIFFQIYSSFQSSINFIKGSVIKQLNIYMVQNSLVKYEMSVLSKLLIHYMTVQEIINQFNIANQNVNQQIYTLPKELLIPVQNLFYGFDCYLSDPASAFSSYPIEYARLIFTFIQCLLLFSVMIFSYAGLILFSITALGNRMQYVRSLYLRPSAIISSVLFIFYFFQQTLTATSLQVITCQTVGNQDYMASQMNKLCYTTEYYNWFPLMISTFISSCFIYPLIIFALLYRNKRKLYQNFYYKTFRRYGFLYYEYREGYWWWEIMKMTMRQIIIIITQLSLFQLLEKVALILLILFIYLIVQLKKNPYKSQKLNQIDHTLNALSIVIIILAVYSEGITNLLQKSIISVLIMVLKFSLLGYIVLRLIESFLAQQMVTIKNSKAICIFRILGEFFREGIFFKKNGVLRRNFPSMYLLMHQPELIGINKHFRWKLIQIHCMDYLSSRKGNVNTDFYHIAQSKQSKMLEDSVDRVKDKSISAACASRILLKSYKDSKLKDSQSFQISNTPKVSQFRNVNGKSQQTASSPMHSQQNRNKILNSFNPQQSIIDNEDNNFNTPGASKFQTSRYEGGEEDYNSKNKLYSNNDTYRIANDGFELTSKQNFTQSLQAVVSAARQNSGKNKDISQDDSRKNTEESNPDMFNEQVERVSDDAENHMKDNYFAELDPRKRKF